MQGSSQTSLPAHGRGPAASAPPLPELHLNGLLAQVRNEVGRAQVAIFAPLPPPVLPAARPTIDWAHLAAVVDEAVEFADAGSTVPELGRRGAALRFMGRLGSRIILALGRVITRRQQRFNHQTLHALRHLGGLLRRLHEGDDELLRGLPQTTHNQHAALVRHQQVLQRHQTLFQQQQAAQQVQETTAQRQQTALRSHQQMLQLQHTLLREYRSRLDEQEARLAALEQRLRELGDTRRGQTDATVPC